MFRPSPKPNSCGRYRCEYTAQLLKSGCDAGVKDGETKGTSHGQCTREDTTGKGRKRGDAIDHGASGVDKRVSLQHKKR